MPYIAHRRSEDNFQEPVLSFPQWDLGIQLRLSGCHGQILYPRSHLLAPCNLLMGQTHNKKHTFYIEETNKLK